MYHSFDVLTTSHQDVVDPLPPSTIPNISVFKSRLSDTDVAVLLC